MLDGYTKSPVLGFLIIDDDHVPVFTPYDGIWHGRAPGGWDALGYDRGRSCAASGSRRRRPAYSGA
jgi:hypothetical protein